MGCWNWVGGCASASAGDSAKGSAGDNAKGAGGRVGGEGVGGAGMVLLPFLAFCFVPCLPQRVKTPVSKNVAYVDTPFLPVIDTAPAHVWADQCLRVEGGNRISESLFGARDALNMYFFCGLPNRSHATNAGDRLGNQSWSLCPARQALSQTARHCPQTARHCPQTARHCPQTARSCPRAPTTAPKSSWHCPQGTRPCLQSTGHCPKSELAGCPYRLPVP